MKRDNTTLLLLGGGALLAYLLYSKATQAAAAVAAGTTAAYNGSVNTVSDFISSLFGPSVTSPSMFYTVVFEDGTSHAVAANTVDASGNFNWTGYPPGTIPAQRLQLLVASDGTKYAISPG